jgi:serine/threonine-protein kinase ULK/ATG1
MSDACSKTIITHNLMAARILSCGSCHLQMNKGLGLQSFSIQLVCLAIWKEALRVCQTWAEIVGDSENGGSSRGRGSSEHVGSQETSVANTCSLMEREFAFAVERAESLAVHINIGDGK